MGYIPSVYMMMVLLIAAFTVIFAFMGINLLAKVIDIMVRWNNGRHGPRR